MDLDLKNYLFHVNLLKKLIPVKLIENLKLFLTELRKLRELERFGGHFPMWFGEVGHSHHAFMMLLVR